MVEFDLNTAVTAGAGGIFGLVGAVIGAVFKFFQTRQQQAFEKSKWHQELALLEAENKRTVDRDERESAVTWEAPVQVDVATHSYKWVNAVKSLYRPVLTTGLVIVTYLVFLNLSGREPSSQVGEMTKYIVDALVFCTGTSIVWWFGDRALAPPGQKNR